MRILFLTSAHNSLSQRLWIELGEHGHDIRVCVAADGKTMIAAVSRDAPDLIIAPMLKIAVPKEIWSRHLCLIVHPGIRGDRGPSSLDWAIAHGNNSWGVTILEAAEEFDAGAIWASHEFAIGEILPRRAAYIAVKLPRPPCAGSLRQSPGSMGASGPAPGSPRSCPMWRAVCARLPAPADAAGRPCHRLDAGQYDDDHAEGPRGGQCSWRPRHVVRQNLLLLWGA